MTLLDVNIEVSKLNSITLYIFPLELDFLFISTRFVGEYTETICIKSCT